MGDDPQGEVEFEAGGKKYVAVFGFKAMKAVEREFGENGKNKPFFQAIASAMPQLSPEDMGDKGKIAAASANISFTAIGALLKAALLKHHPDMTEDDVEGLVDEIGLGRMSQIIGDALTAALVREGDGSSTANPPHRARKTG